MNLDMCTWERAMNVSMSATECTDLNVRGWAVITIGILLIGTLIYGLFIHPFVKLQKGVKKK